MEIFSQVQQDCGSKDVPSVLASLFAVIAVRSHQYAAAAHVVAELKHRSTVQRVEVVKRLKDAGTGRILLHLLLHGHQAAVIKRPRLALSRRPAKFPGGSQSSMLKQNSCGGNGNRSCNTTRHEDGSREGPLVIAGEQVHATYAHPHSHRIDQPNLPRCPTLSTGAPHAFQFSCAGADLQE